MKLTTAALCAIVLVPCSAFATLYAPGVEAGYSSFNGASGSFLYGANEFSTWASWQGKAQWDGINTDKSATISSTSNTYPNTTGATEPYNAIGRTQSASAYANPGTGQLGASVSSYINLIHRNPSNPMSGYANASAWGEIADNITVTGTTPVEVTFRMRMHGIQGFTDTDINYHLAKATMNGAIAVMETSPQGNWYVGAEASVPFDDMNANGASIDQILSYTTLLQPGSTLAHARFDVAVQVSFSESVTFDPGAFSNGANTGTFWITVPEADLGRVSSQNGLFTIAVPEPTMISGTCLAAMLLLKRHRRAGRQD